MMLVDPFEYAAAGMSTMHWERVPDGFPPLVVYPLEDSPSFGDRLLCEGPPAIFYRRQEVGAQGNPHLGQPIGADIDSIRLGWLATMLERADCGLEAWTQSVHRWKNKVSLKKHVKELRGKIDTAHGRLVAELVAKELLSPVLAKDTKARIKLHLVDQRKDKTVPLKLP